MKKRNGKEVNFEEYKEVRNLALLGMRVMLAGMVEDETDEEFNAVIMNYIVMVVSKIQGLLYGIPQDEELDEFFTPPPEDDSIEDEEDSCAEADFCEEVEDFDEMRAFGDDADTDEEPAFFVDGNDYIVLDEHGYECDEDFSKYDEDDGLDEIEEIEDEDDYDEWDELADGFAPDFDEPFEVIFDEDDDGEDVQDKIA
ncbi:MAG: hypothetical protein IK020_05245 [Clostridiales bacterium]|nr:hypothetical protein [Clostridiales bacterium]